MDKFDRAYGQPADDQVLGHSPIPARLGQTSIGAFFSDMTYYTATVQRITGNILRLFGQGPATSPPSPTGAR